METAVFVAEDTELKCWNAYSLRGAPEHDLCAGGGARRDC